MEVLPFSQMNIRTSQTNNAYIPQEGYSIPLSYHLDWKLTYQMEMTSCVSRQGQAEELFSPTKQVALVHSMGSNTPCLRG